jgi:cyclopropane-fatty-acyl-phospholipid synthase
MVKVGRLKLIDHKGRVYETGDGTGPQITIRLTGASTALFLGLNPELALGECYMDGRVKFEEGDLAGLLDLVGATHKPKTKRSLMSRMRNSAKRQLQQWNDRDVSKKNVAHHYDISNDLYRRFLDPDMNYSCAYFSRPDMTLEEAQAAKKAHIAAKLDLRDGLKLLDIGSGWGGLGLDLASRADIQVKGVTLSERQLALARERVEAKGLGDRVKFELQDYRDVEGPFDRIVSVGMFEHVGRPNYQTFFDTAAKLLKDDGVMLLHSIGRCHSPGVTNSWLAKYIFPGGYCPSLSEVFQTVEKSGLIVSDVEILRLHYAETCKAWRERFLAQWDEIAAEYDEAFCRMFDYYLVTSEITFRYLNFMVFQMQLVKRVGTLPMTRDYIGEAEARYTAAGAAAPKRMAEAQAG